MTPSSCLHITPEQKKECSQYKGYLGLYDVKLFSTLFIILLAMFKLNKIVNGILRGIGKGMNFDDNL